MRHYWKMIPTNLLPDFESSSTPRGFALIEFVDKYGEKCSLQKSSAGSEHCIWLGVNKPIPKVCILGTGWVDVELPNDALVSGRMHLTQEHVKNLLPFLQKFAETGEIE